MRYFCKKIIYSMIIEFSVKNFKTFREEAKLSLVASKYDKSVRVEGNLTDIPAFGFQLLKSAAIYGANASGKTKLLEAMGFMQNFMRRSSIHTQLGDPIKVEPFRLNPQTEKEPSVFELIFVQDNALYRYGFEVTPEKVVAEWLYVRPKTKEIEVFYREGQNFEHLHPTYFRIGGKLAKDKIVRENALMLSVAAQFNDVTAQKVFEFLAKITILPNSTMDTEGLRLSPHLSVLDFMKAADFGIVDLTIRDNQLKTLHRKYDAEGNFVGTEEFSMNREESAGTQKYFSLSNPILDALSTGQILVIDELEAHLHPNLVAKIIELFNSATTNPHHAQLIFNTHDVNLLSADLMRRDQIWFVEKDRYGAASLYCLADFKTDLVRKGDNFEQKYLEGRYGAIPYLSAFDRFLTPQNAVA